MGISVEENIQNKSKYKMQVCISVSLTSSAILWERNVCHKRSKKIKNHYIWFTRCFNLCNSSAIAFGKSLPNCSAKYFSKSTTSSSQKSFGKENNSSQFTSSFKPFVSIEPGLGINPIGLGWATSASSHRFSTQSSTLEFSPNPGHKKEPYFAKGAIEESNI